MKNHLYAQVKSRHLLNLALTFCLAFPLPSLAASVALATAPLATSTTSSVMPNIMFMLDDSGSMDWDYMPDDAKNFSGKYGYNTSHCNGVYYDPTITYTAPVKSDGTSYPDASFSAAWKSGYNTGLGTVNLGSSFTGGSGSGASGINLPAGPAFFYTYSGTQTAGVQMDFHNTTSIFYHECISPYGSTTVYDGTNQVKNVFTKHTLATSETTTLTVLAAGGGATITVSGSNRTIVSDVTVNGVHILDAATSRSSNSSTVAGNIAAGINNCTSAVTGLCTTAGGTGFSATVSGNVITILGPSTSSGFSPVVTNGTCTSPCMSYTSTAFPTVASTYVSGITVNGILISSSTASTTLRSTLAASIAAAINSPYSATVSANVVTITGPVAAGGFTPVVTTVPASGGLTVTAGTFPETDPVKLQNFSNWYSYYSNRMLMMKTGVGQAFASIGNTYRVGFMTMNNNISPDIVDINAFSGGCAVGSGTCQKDKWYTKLYAATPGNSTPLREALSHVGQLYAHRFGTYYTYTATITVANGGAGNSTGVSSITVNGTETMAGTSASSTSTSTVAANIAAQINLLDPSDYGASSSGSVVTITGPSSAYTPTPALPVINDDGGGMTFTATHFVQNTITAQLNGILPADPVQYSCQQNFVILSTDGYWNGATTYDLSSPALPVGNQDGTAPRPMYDGATATQTTSQTYQSQTQLTATTTQLQSKTTQLQKQISQQQQDVGTLQYQTSTLQKRTGTLQGTLSQVLMKCNNTVASCGAAPSNGVAAGSWAVVTSGSCTTGTNVQCAKITVSGASAVTSNVATSCNTSASISTTTSAPSNVTSAYVSDNSHKMALGLSATNPDASNGHCQQLGTANAWFCRGSSSSNPVVSSSSVTDSNGTTWYLVSSVTGNTGCTTNNTEWGSGYSTSYGACQGTTSGYTLNNADTNGNIYSACSYNWGAWADSVAACTPSASASSPYTITSATACQYATPGTSTPGWSNWTNGACSAVAQNNTNLTAKQCQYSWNNAQGTQSCSAPAYVANNYTNATVYRNCQTAITTPYANNACTANATLDLNGFTTQCQELCNGQVEAVPGTCSAWVGAASCAISNTIATNGQAVYCPNPNPAVTGPTPVASCTAQSANAGNSYTKIDCATNTLQASTLVPSCTVQSASSSNNYVATACNTVTLATTNNASGCTPGNSGAPNYIQTTCTGAAGGTSNTLADVAMYYYMNDLRDTSLANCTGALGTDVCYNNVHITGVDNNVKQHLTTYTLGLGARGRMVYTSKDYMNDTSGDFYSVKKGLATNLAANPPICSWQTAGSTCNWPVPASGSINNIDDLWHAAVNGRGTYFSATDPAALSDGLTSALSSITARRGAAAAAATSTLNPVAGNNFAYVASYTTVAWTGNLEARAINTTTGVIDKNASWCVESLAADLCTSPSYISNNGSTDICVTPNSTSANCLSPSVFDASSNTCSVQIALACTGTMPSMVSPATDSRKILTAGSASTAGMGLVNFKYNELSATQQAYFNNISGLSQWPDIVAAGQQATAAGANLVDYLRGQNNYDDRASHPVNNRLYRFREAVLGDALESQPTFIAGPTFSYADTGYSAFAVANANRAGMVYMGTNDGMLHAFYGQDKVAHTLPAKCVIGAVSGEYCGGEEAWAFVPSMVMPNMWKLADANYSTQHSNFVNGSPIISDYWCTQDCGSLGGVPQWRTILVGGLNAGGREYYALDITDPASPSLLWEFTSAQDHDLGYSFGLPVVTKLTNGSWVVLVTSGYDNGDLSSNPAVNNSPQGSGLGYLYVLDARTGAIVNSGGGKISTGVGTAATPSGLAKIAAWNSAASSNEASYVYGGDLLGNVWRFNINASGSPFKLAILKDPSGVVQPVTTTPTLGLILNKRVIFVGTGKYLETPDLTNYQVQTIYAIKDDDATITLNNPRNYTAPSPNSSNTPNLMVKQTIVPNGSIRDIVDTTLPCGPCNKNPVDFAVDRGWYIDLPDTGERVNIDSKLVLGALLIPTIVPSNTVCSPGGYGWLNFFDFTNGWPITDGTGVGAAGTNTNVSVKYDATIVGMNILYIQGKPVVEVVTSDNPTPTVDSKVIINPGTSTFAGKRMQWRELIP